MKGRFRRCVTCKTTSLKKKTNIYDWKYVQKRHFRWALRLRVCGANRVALASNGMTEYAISLILVVVEHLEKETTTS